MAKFLDGVVTKKSHLKEQFTEAQIKDLIACSDPEDGYLYFARNFYYIQHPTKGKMIFAPFVYQEGLLKSYHNYTFNVNILPRQSGKCLTSTAMINIRNKITGELREITIGDFYDMQKNKSGG